MLTFSDQIPVWLKTEAGKILQPAEPVRYNKALAKRRRLLRKEADQAELAKTQAEQDGDPQLAAAEAEKAEAALEDLGATAEKKAIAKGPGVASASRWRISFIARQAVHCWFQSGKPTGAVLDSILVSYGRHCRLENISADGCWLEDEEFCCEGLLVSRKKGQKAGLRTMAGWRKLRAEHPELFRGLAGCMIDWLHG